MMVAASTSAAHQDAVFESTCATAIEAYTEDGYVSPVFLILDKDDDVGHVAPIGEYLTRGGEWAAQALRNAFASSNELAIKTEGGRAFYGYIIVSECWMSQETHLTGVAPSKAKDRIEAISVVAVFSDRRKRFRAITIADGKVLNADFSSKDSLQGEAVGGVLAEIIDGI